jgi:hypothetical protein
MPFELYQTNSGSRGSMAEVWIDSARGICKKFYKPNGITIRGSTPLHVEQEQISALYQNEIKWSSELNHDCVIKIYEHGPLLDQFGYYILQEYVGPDLLHYYDNVSRLAHVIPDAVEQLVDMFKLFKQHNLYKCNNAMCNLTHKDGKIKAFDFKYAVERSPNQLHWEEKTINEWLSKIEPDIMTRLRPLL